MQFEFNFSSSEFKITVDEVLCALGANPEIIRSRRPAIVESTQEAIRLGMEKAHPLGWVKILRVQSLLSDRFLLEGGQVLSGDLILKQLTGSKTIACVIGTLGMDLQEQITHSMREDASFGLILDTVGSMLAEALAQKLEALINVEVKDHMQTASLALSPGLTGWPVDEGQPQIFNIIHPDPARIQLMPSAQMIPQKSISFVMGIGCPEGLGNRCDFCPMGQTCSTRMQS